VPPFSHVPISFSPVRTILSPPTDLRVLLPDFISSNNFSGLRFYRPIPLHTNCSRWFSIYPRLSVPFNDSPPPPIVSCFSRLSGPRSGIYPVLYWPRLYATFDTPRLLFAELAPFLGFLTLLPIPLSNMQKTEPTHSRRRKGSGLGNAMIPPEKERRGLVDTLTIFPPRFLFVLFYPQTFSHYFCLLFCSFNTAEFFVFHRFSVPSQTSKNDFC